MNLKNVVNFEKAVNVENVGGEKCRWRCSGSGFVVVRLVLLCIYHVKERVMRGRGKC